MTSLHQLSAANFMEVPSPPGTGGAGRVWPVAPGGSSRTSWASEDVLYDGGGAIHLGHVRMYKAKENTKSRNYPEKIF